MSAPLEMADAIRRLVRRSLHKEVRALLKLKGGRNSQVFRVDCSDDSMLAAKCYFRSSADQRDRLGCEFRALTFLQASGVTTIPRPIVSDEAEGIGLYQFIGGAPVSSSEVAEPEIDQVVAFLVSLKRLTTLPEAAKLPPASEACFSVNAIFESIDRRLHRLKEAAGAQPALASFLLDELAPFRKDAEQWCRDFCAGNGIHPAAEIDAEARTLSPSDFGFHNTLRGVGGRLTFLDFEYFGRDDPAKTISDFLLHPGMELSPLLKQRFFAGALTAFSHVPQIEARTRAVYPLFGLKWCTILLNEFTLDHMARRRFADRTSGVWSPAAQLEKAHRTLAQTMDDCRNFPYHA